MEDFERDHTHTPGVRWQGQGTSHTPTPPPPTPTPRPCPNPCMSYIKYDIGSYRLEQDFGYTVCDYVDMYLFVFVVTIWTFSKREKKKLVPHKGGS